MTDNMSQVMLMRALKGAPMSIIMIMLAHPGRSWGTMELVTWSGYSKPAVGEGLQVLAGTGLAQQHARYNGWMPSLYARQLFLGEEPPDVEDEPVTIDAVQEPETEAETAMEVRKYLPSSSSSCGLDFLSEKDQTTTTTTNGGEVKKFDLPPPLPPPWAEIDELLRVRCGTPRSRALEAAQNAMAGGHLPGWCKRILFLWLMYCQSEQGAGIQNSGFLIAKRVEEGISPPETFKPDCQHYLYDEFQAAHQQWVAEGGDPSVTSSEPGNSRRRYIEGEYADLIQH